MIIDRTYCRMPLALVVLVALLTNVHALEWSDDFNDGNAEDGNPVMWTPLTDFLPGNYDASSGDYILTPTNDSNPKEALVATVNDATFGDTYARTLAYVDSPSNVGNVGLIIRFDPSSISGYIGVIDNGRGYLTMALIEFGQIAFQWEQIMLEPITAKADIMMEFTAVGNQLSLTAWDPEQPKPEPQITASDLTLSNGPAGIIFVEDNNNTAGVFRWAAASDVPFVDASADFDQDGDIDGADFNIWQQGFGISSGATLADGDADGNKIVDGADLEVWKANFGTTGSPLAIDPIPEPASILLASMFAIGLAVASKGRRSCNANTYLVHRKATADEHAIIPPFFSRFVSRARHRINGSSRTYCSRVCRQ